jgi:hypothetical protein
MIFKSASDHWRIQLLLGCFALLVFAFAIPKSAGANGEHKFIGHRKCKTCHEKQEIGNQYDIWLESSHAKTYATLATDKAREWATEAGVDDPQADERCIKCHTTAHGIPDDMVSKKFDRTSGVQCEACHGAGKNYRKKSVMIDREKALAKGLIPQTAAVCTACHNDESPAWDPERYSLADGRKVGFDYEQAVSAIAHPVPEGYDAMAAGEAD